MVTAITQALTKTSAHCNLMLVTHTRNATKIVKILFGTGRKLLSGSVPLRLCDGSCATKPTKFIRPAKHVTQGHGSTHEVYLRETEEKKSKSEETRVSLSDSLEHFEKYIGEPTRTFDDLLSIDVRPLPSGVRLSCLEAVLNLSHSSHLELLKSHSDQPLNRGWPIAYLASEHAVRWHGWDLGINPHIVPGEEPHWFRSQQFDLLVLSTAASANQLPLPRLLRLVGHFRYIWWYYDPAVYASILRLLTTQVNELSLQDLFRLASVLRGVSATQPPDTYRTAEPEASQTVFGEVKLLRTAVISHVCQNVRGLDSTEALCVLRFIEEISPNLTKTKMRHLFGATCDSLSTNPAQQNLYTLLFSCVRLSLLGIVIDALFRKFMVQIRRKLYLTRLFPGNDQTVWLGTAVAALANLHVGSPHAIGIPKDEVEPFATPPVMPYATIPQGYSTDSNFHSGIDLAHLLRIDWIKGILANIAGYVAKMSSVGSNPGLNFRLQIAYSLALLGYRADSILSLGRPSSRQHDSSLDTTREPPWQSMVELLVGPSDSPATSLNDLVHLDWIPRVDWQFYYRLASEVSNNITPSESGSANQLSHYIRLKRTAVDSVANKLRSRIKTKIPLDVSAFMRCRLDSNGPSFFCDLLFRKHSSKSPELTKLALCFITCKRDTLVNRPLDALLNTYRTALSGIPLLVFDYTDFADADTAKQVLFCDEFLEKVAHLMMESPGVPTELLDLFTDPVA